MRHGRRTTLTVSDMEQAFKVLNIEPLYGHSQHNPPVFRRALPYPNSNAGPVYFVEDEEIDFDRVLREEKLALPKGVTYHAHWLAVEGVQPQIPENPPGDREGGGRPTTTEREDEWRCGYSGRRRQEAATDADPGSATTAARQASALARIATVLHTLDHFSVNIIILRARGTEETRRGDRQSEPGRRTSSTSSLSHPMGQRERRCRTQGRRSVRTRRAHPRDNVGCHRRPDAEHNPVH